MALATGPAAGGERTANMWWNFSTFGGDIAFFSLGLAISSVYTVLPLFVLHLTPDNLAVAAIPAIRSLGLFGPQLLAAPWVERLRHAKPFIMVATIFERVPYLVLALGALLLAADHPGWLLALFYAMLFIALFAGGITYPAWLDMIARAIPGRWLGRFMGLWTGMGNFLGIGGAAIATAILARASWPGSFALCFTLTGAAMAVSFVLLALGREPERLAVRMPTAKARERATARLGARELVALVRGDAALPRLLAGNALVGISTMAAALFAVAAKRQGGLSDADVGAQTTLLFAATTAGYFIWGAVGDRFGHRAIYAWGSLCAAASALLALGAHGFGAYAAVFLLLGLNVAAVNLAGFTLITEYGPLERRPTYIALASVAYAPFVIGAPILGGFLADRFGYAPVFVLSALAAVAATWAFLLWVPAPPHAAR
ncbi:MAG TPA: MFS transporter [Ktedonobacterales bacterium]